MDLLREDQACSDIVIWHSRREGWEDGVRFQGKRRKAHRGGSKPRNSKPTEAAHYVPRKGMNGTRCDGFVVIAFKNSLASQPGMTCTHERNPTTNHCP